MAENRRRRRKKNPLLMRILVISVVAHAIALPIAAHYGAFEKIKKSFGDSQVVMFTTPPIENKEKPAEKAKPKKAEPTKKAPGLKGKVASNGPPAPKVVAGGPATGDGGGGPSVEQGSGQAGVLPVTKTPGNEPPVTKPPVTEPPVTKPPVTEPPVTKPPVTEPPVTKPPVVTPPVEPKPKRVVAAEATVAPEPVIPDDLRSEPLDKTMVVEADVDAQGIPGNIKVASSTGIRELDEVGLDTARKYRFRPATVDDVPVGQHVRFTIIFNVQ